MIFNSTLIEGRVVLPEPTSLNLYALIVNKKAMKSVLVLKFTVIPNGIRSIDALVTLARMMVACVLVVVLLGMPTTAVV